MLRVMGEITSTQITSTHPRPCACGEPRSTADAELIEGARFGGKGFMEVTPIRQTEGTLGPSRVRPLRACRRCGAVYFPSS